MRAQRKWLVSLVSGHQLTGLLGRYLLDEAKFLSPYGVRSLSAEYRGQPYVFDVGGVRGSIDYQPAESTDGAFGGNSNWRGPVWWPLNYLLVDTLADFGEHFGDTLTVELPAGSGQQSTLLQVAADLRGRLIALFLRGDDGRRPCHGELPLLQHARPFVVMSTDLQEGRHALRQRPRDIGISLVGGLPWGPLALACAVISVRWFQS